MGIAAGYLLIFFVLAVALAYVVFMSDSAIGHLDFISNRTVANRVIDIIKSKHLENGSFYDLGSAKGVFAARIAKTLPKLSVCGIDDSGFRIFCSNISAKFFKNLKFKKQDIFNADVSTANVVYLYLPQELMPALQTKLQKELKPGSLVISNSVSFSSWIPSETIAVNKNKSDFKKLFVYKLA